MWHSFPISPWCDHVWLRTLEWDETHRQINYDFASGLDQSCGAATDAKSFFVFTKPCKVALRGFVNTK